MATFHDELTFTRLSDLSDENVKLPVEPDGVDLGLWYTFDGITDLFDKAYFDHVGVVVGNTSCGVLAEGVDEGTGASGIMCMKFDDGVDNIAYIKTDTSDQTEITNQTTGFNFFLRFNTGDPNPFQTLFEKIDDTTPDYGYKVVLAQGNLVFIVMYNGTLYIAGTGDNVISSDTWYDCWFRFNIGTTTADMYVNNTQYTVGNTGAGFDSEGFSSTGFDTSFVDAPFSSFITNGTSLIIGNSADLDSPYIGYIQDFRIWDNVIISSTSIGQMWTNKASISDIEYEKVCTIGFSLINGRVRRSFEDAIIVTDESMAEYLVSTPGVVSSNETVDDDAGDTPTVVKNPIIPIVVNEEVSGQVIDSVDEGVITIKQSVEVRVGNIIKSTQKTGLPFTRSYSQEVGFRPKLMIFWGTFNTQYGVYNGDNRFFIGFSDGTNDIALASSAADNSSSSDSAHGLYNSAINYVQYDNTSEVLASCTFTDEGFRLHYTENDTNDARILNYIAIGGTVVTGAKVGTFTQPTSTGNNAVTGVGFLPDMLMFLPSDLTTVNSKAVDAIMSFGAGKDSVEEFSISGADEDSQSTTSTKTIARLDRCITQIAGNGSTQKSATINSMDSDGFTLNYSVAGGVAGRCGYAALKGMQCFIGSFTPTSGTGLQNITYSTGETAGDHPQDLTFKPSMIIFMGNGQINGTSPTSEFRFGFGAATSSTRRRSATMHIEDSVSTSIAVDRSQSSKCYQIIEAASSSQNSNRIFEMDLVSLNSTGFTVNKTDNNISNHVIMYIALG